MAEITKRRRVPVRLDDDFLLTYEEVADWLGVSPTQVGNLVRGVGGKRGQYAAPLPVRRIGWKQRVRVGDLRAWIRQTPQAGV
jgi:hypothetical protein